MNVNYELVFKNYREVVIEECPVPVTMTGQVLIKTEATLISTGTELTVLEGKDIPSGSNWDNHIKMPYKPGYNNIGTVIDVDEGVDQGLIGKKVATYGKHAMYVVAKEQDLRFVPPEVRNEHSVFFTIAEIAMQGVRRGNLHLGEIAVVYGLGLIGQLMVRFCRMCGAKAVIAVDVSEERLKLLPKDHNIISVNPDRQDIIEIVRTASKGRMADVVYEATGIASLIPGEFAVLRPQGRFVVVSSPRGKTWFDFHDLCNGPSYTIIGAHNYSHTQYETPENPWTMKRDCEYFFDMLKDGDIDVSSLISHQVTYLEAVDMYRILLDDRTKAMGIVLEWD